MADLVHDCPRCGAQSITFDVRDLHPYRRLHTWQNWYEAFAVCKRCKHATIFVVSDAKPDSNKIIRQSSLEGLPEALNSYLFVQGFINVKDLTTKRPPDHVPEPIKSVFVEGAQCLVIDCYNAAGTMFRLCIDLVTRPMVPDNTDRPPKKVCRDLGLRLPWLFDNGKLPEALRDISTCVREDGNDGAHAGTLGKEDAQDLLDFTHLLLERIYTEPKRLELAAKRRKERRKAKDS